MKILSEFDAEQGLGSGARTLRVPVNLDSDGDLGFDLYEGHMLQGSVYLRVPALRLLRDHLDALIAEADGEAAFSDHDADPRTSVVATLIPSGVKGHGATKGEAYAAAWDAYEPQTAPGLARVIGTHLRPGDDYGKAIHVAVAPSLFHEADVWISVGGTHAWLTDEDAEALAAALAPVKDKSPGPEADGVPEPTFAPGDRPPPVGDLPPVEALPLGCVLDVIRTVANAAAP